MKRALGLALLLAGCASAPPLAMPDPRAEVVPAVPTGVEPAFPNLKFEAPVDLVPGEAGMLYVLEQRSGLVKRFADNPQTAASEVVVDLSARISREGSEDGLLGLAYSPEAIYLNYTMPNPLRTVIARFKKGADGKYGHEEVLLTFDQPYANHNGGSMAFGPDGFLYIGTGDGGSGGDPHGNGQNLNSLLGKILRLDVQRAEGGKAYGIPADNPFGGIPNARREIWAYGLRNPWRLSFDPVDGKLWVGDVGQDAFEEVTIVGKGENHGWNRMEGKSCYKAETCDKTGLTLPVLAYGRELGSSITGGHVYRGKRFGGLVGQYVYGDFASGRIWRHPGGQIVDTDLSISTFGRDAAGEILPVDYASGQIYKLR